ncbi:MAG: diguanylate cyclase [Clostridia bacterium]|nr:diguanylate cyclase [Clostridia bacterium]
MKNDFRKTGYLVVLSLLIMAILVITFAYEIAMIRRQTGILAVNTAKAYLATVVGIREWNARNDGVYVFADKVRSNPYLKDPLRDLETTEGYLLTKLNPAYMTRLLGEVTSESYGIGFRLTSLWPINPDNVPDKWEKEALKSFEQGEHNKWYEAGVIGDKQLRYMEPLFLTEECLACHGDQGYQVNELRGGISVSLPYEPFLSVQRSQMKSVVIRYAIFAIILLVSAGIFTKNTLSDERKKRNYAVQLERLSRIDELTGLLNRRAIMDELDRNIQAAVDGNSPLSIILFDLDSFKQVNDNYGHLVGDLILKHSATVIQRNVRDIDSVGRYGGDEIMVVLPGLPGNLAEKVKARIEEAMNNSPFYYQDLQLCQRLSGGIGSLPVGQGEEGNLEKARQSLIQAADDELYKEKQLRKGQL